MSELYHPTGRQVSAARALCGMSQAELASLSRISIPTLRRMEASEGTMPGMPNNVQAVISALEGRGVVFTASAGRVGVEVVI